MSDPQYPPPPPPLPYADQEPAPLAPRNGLGVGALVVAIIGLVTCWTVVGGVVLGIAAVVMGFVARNRVKRAEADNGGVALAGIALGFLAIVAGLVFVVIWVKTLADVGFRDYYDCMTQAGQDQSKQQECAHQFTQTVESKLSVTLTPSR